MAKIDFLYLVLNEQLEMRYYQNLSWLNFPDLDFNQNLILTAILCQIDFISFTSLLYLDNWSKVDANYSASSEKPDF